MAYDPRPVEPVIYKRWLEAGVFQPRPDGEPYVIVIPPPNVTAVLHVGHALNNIIQDVLIRFERLWDEGLIYRGHRVIHWCPHCLTALSDEEAEHHETKGNLYHIKYPLEDGSGAVTVATTRPETMFGDIGLVFNPKDSRYKGLKGKRVKIPLSGVVIPIATDEAVDQAFGTGMLKVTPAHDANDFDIANRAWPKEDKPLIMTEDAKMAGTGDGGRVPPDLQGLEPFDAREKIVEQLEQEGPLVKGEQHRHSVKRRYPCRTVLQAPPSD